MPPPNLPSVNIKPAILLMLAMLVINDTLTQMQAIELLELVEELYKDNAPVDATLNLMILRLRAVKEAKDAT